ncbi:MAG: hypothetical protein B9S34_09605 [Opitutia bacterium Tous-C1TDCM]|nr:MAG: hypothetical protein B9S34_09605 [Opitutae bacterium Tous-C1TDCM]
MKHSPVPLPALVLALVLASVAAPLPAQTVADDFSTAGALVGSTPDAGTGLWTQIGASAASPLTVAGGSLALAASSGQSAQLNFAAGDVAAGTIYAGITFSVTPGTISSTSGTISTFFGFRSGTAATGDYEVAAGLFRPNGTAQTAGALPTTTSQFQVGFGDGAALPNGGTRWTETGTTGTSYRLVLAWNLDTDSARLWLNPTSELSAFTDIGSGLTGVARGIFVRQGAATSGQINLSNLQVATDFATAAAIPEPSTYATAAGLAVLGLAWFRRHRARFGNNL